ncbi:MAG: endonuclease [Flavobacteriales bacterium]|nr:endonuclease [Flavobacteriales bacterium]
MKKIFLLFGLMLISGLSIAQISSSTKSLLFNFVFVGSSDTLPLTISNSGSNEVVFEDVFVLYRQGLTNNDTAFYLTGHKGKLSIPSGKSVDLKVVFRPGHNITYLTQLVFLNKDTPGNLAVNLSGSGKYTNTYYQSTFDLYDENLKTALKSILSNNTKSLGYNGARDEMYANIDNKGGLVECIYTGRKASFNTRSGATSNGFNCEHTFPQSNFNQNEPMRSDVHHLFSTDETANNKRSNYAFGEVSNPNWSVGGSKLESQTFEPRDEQKGATARAMMYFVIRYSDYNSFFSPQENILRNWHGKFLPNSSDVQRNEAIYKLQNNRNPFIDYPGLEDRITSFSSTKNRIPFNSVYQSNTSVDFGSVKEEDTITYEIILAETATKNSDVVVPVQFKHGIIEVYGNDPIKAGSFLSCKLKLITNLLPSGSLLDSFKISINGQEQYIKYKAEKILAGSGDEFKKALNLLNTSDHTLRFSHDLERGNGVEIFNQYGQKVFFTEINSPLNDIPIPYLQPGCYFVLVNSGVNNSLFKTMVLN